MIFSALAKFLKTYLNSDKPIVGLLPVWMRLKLKEAPAKDNVARILQAEFRLKEIEKSKVFFIIPRSQRAKELLKFLKEYIQVMESTRFARWLDKIEPKDFDNLSYKE